MVDQTWKLGRPSLHAFVKAIAYYTFLLSLPYVLVDTVLHLFMVRDLPLASPTAKTRWVLFTSLAAMPCGHFPTVVYP